ncbi:MAG: hypothetical protein ACTTKO_04060 [Candidatus Limimorpha sp.]
MKLILIGNIGAGKTTIANLIFERYKDAEFISIDGIRKKYGDGTIERENYCKDKFIEAIDLKTKFQIIELTGVGVLGERLFELLSNYKQPILVFYLIAPLEDLLSRAKEKILDTPFPLGKDNIPTAIGYTEDRFNEGLADSLIAKCANAILVSLPNNNETMMKENLKIIFSKIESYRNRKKDV